jgi:hypothetical protein
MTATVADVLRDIGYEYDASTSRRPGSEWEMFPYALPDGDGDRPLWELALMLWRDANGDLISGYLWRLLENDRRPEHYVQMAGELANQFPGGLLQLALHPWHLTIDEEGNRYGDPASTRMRLATTLKSIMALQEIRFVTVGGYLDRHLKRINRA